LERSLVFNDFRGPDGSLLSSFVGTVLGGCTRNFLFLDAFETNPSTGTYSGEDDRLFGRNVTGDSAESAL
jgi:hypothetical protein